MDDFRDALLRTMGEHSEKNVLQMRGERTMNLTRMTGDATNDLVERVIEYHSEDDEYQEEENERHKIWTEARLICEEHFRVCKKYQNTTKKNKQEMDVLPEEA